VTVFIDLGAYRGATIGSFRRSRAFVEGQTAIYAWECNPHLADVDYGEGVTVVRAAAWVADGELPFYISRVRPEKVQGSSVCKNKRTGNLDVENPVVVQTIDFARWLGQFAAVDHVVVKMNIEGAEYDVLEHLCDTQAIRLIDVLHVQWHWNKCGIAPERHRALVSRLEAIDTLVVHPGYGVLRSGR